MNPVLFFITCFFALVTATHGLNCSQLDIGTSIYPQNGSSLMYCRTTSLQCCTDNYFNEKKITIKQNLINGLIHEFNQSNFVILCRVVDALENFIDNTFLQELASCVPLLKELSQSNQNTLSMQFIQTLSTNFIVDTTNNFNVSMYFDTFIDNVKTQFITDFIAPKLLFSLNSVTHGCIKEKIDTMFNTTIIAQTVANVEKLRRIHSVMKAIKKWYKDVFLLRVSNGSFVDKCLDTFLQLRCAACIRNIQPLCWSVCTYLTQGCYVPYRQGLRSQLDILWNVTRQVIDQVEQAVTDAISSENNIFTIDFNNNSQFMSFKFEVSTSCNVVFRPNFGRKRRATNNPLVLPSSIILNVTALNGSYTYDEDGPIFCHSRPITNCWDGDKERQMDDDIDDIDDSIQFQDMNPVVSFNRRELIELARSLGTPVNDFLSEQSFLEIAPSGLLILPGQLFSLILEDTSTPTPSITSVATTPLTSTIKSTSSMLKATTTPTIAGTKDPNSGTTWAVASLGILVFSLIVTLLLY